MRTALLVLLIFTNNIFANDNLAIVFISPYDLNTTANKVQASISATNYKIYSPRKLLEDLASKDEIDKYSSDQIVIRFCNFANMQKFLKIEINLGIILPCRVTVIKGNDNKVRVVIENYRKTINEFNNKELSAGVDELIDELTESIKEALW